MRKIVLGMLILLNLFIMPIHAYLLPEPEKDDFYRKYRDEIINASSMYVCAHRQIPVYDAPDSDNIIGVIEKGAVLHLWYSYEDEKGNMLGMQIIDEQNIWFPLKYTSDYHWYFNFWNDYQDKFKKTYHKQILFEEDAWLILWEYPGSDRISGTLATEHTRSKEYPIYEGMEYVDKNGKRWTIRI